ncbi:hypothetical protein GCM10010495_60930 [Kitasatospora herbaricolor]|uniref:hypothetical protein n=1 Tax=Kitasatospora herbaricolor TaxID=68217 RepID=UPI00174E42B3|nr:hypothetical protein [Kitasatospora herbaricolor]MDQ0312878.1 hypothetical protein [Kitasatospora herbaricolor]GGV35753.1 hypothetical protein GCM10010495_60930 [Kitasatospora herbaricolor]
MNSNTTTRTHVRRTVLITTLVAAVALPTGLTASARATTGGAAAGAVAHRTVSGKSSDDLTRVADFYGAYIDARLDAEDGGLAAELRKFYVRADYLGEVAKWEEANQADGILRAQNVPLKWTVKENGAPGQVGITLAWGQAATTRLVVDLDRNHKITHIGAPGAGGN